MGRDGFIELPENSDEPQNHEESEETNEDPHARGLEEIFTVFAMSVTF